MKHKRMLTVVFSLILALTLSICSVFADNFSSPELPSDEELLTLVEDSVNAYKKQYELYHILWEMLSKTFAFLMRWVDFVFWIFLYF